MTRRDLLRSAGVSVFALGGARLAKAFSESELTPIPDKRLGLLDEVERRACLYFYEQAHPATGLVMDRARTDGREDRKVASIAATGFGLSAMCIAHQRGFLTRAAAQER